MDNQVTWEERIANAFKELGYDGIVRIEPTRNGNEYLINHSDFGCPFTGEFSKDGTYFTVYTFERYTKAPDEDFQRLYCEGLVFDSETLRPLYYSIYHEPENQKIMMEDFGKYKVGDILYNAKCKFGWHIEKLIDNPYFCSEIFDLNLLIPKR